MTVEGKFPAKGLTPGRINLIHKQLARNVGLDESVIERISGHSMGVGAAQDL